MAKPRIQILISPTIVFILIAAFFIASCYYDSEEEIYKNFKEAQNCDTLNITYTKNIKKIFDQHCISCHNASYPSCNLTNFTDAHNYAVKINSNLYTTVSDNTHKGVKLDPCEKKQLKIWINEGAKE